MGLVQGLTEFLPVSSSGHLVLFARVTGTEPSLYFDLILHLGTLGAVLVCFNKEILGYAKKPLSKPSLMLGLATAITAVTFLVLRPLAEREFSGDNLPFFFLLTAVILFAGTIPRYKTLKAEVGVFDAITIGLTQGLAAFPGLSRSGLTSSAGNLLGLNKKQNVDFCFILSVPIIIGSAAVELIGGEAIPVSFGCLAVGFITAFSVGLLSLKFVKRAFERTSVGVFSAYLTLLAAFLLVNDNLLHLF